MQVNTCAFKSFRETIVSQSSFTQATQSIRLGLLNPARSPGQIISNWFLHLDSPNCILIWIFCMCVCNKCSKPGKDKKGSLSQFCCVRLDVDNPYCIRTWGTDETLRNGQVSDGSDEWWVIFLFSTPSHAIHCPCFACATGCARLPASSSRRTSWTTSLRLWDGAALLQAGVLVPRPRPLLPLLHSAHNVPVSECCLCLLSCSQWGPLPPGGQNGGSLSYKWITWIQ